MTRRILIASLMLMSACARPAAAGFPDPPGNPSTVPSAIMVVGSTAGLSDPHGAFIVVVRDFANTPIAGSEVWIDFSNASDVRLASAAGPGLSVNCDTRSIQTVTDQNGVAAFSIRGSSRVGPPSSYTDDVRIYADGVLLATVPCSTPDLDGIGGLGAGDLSIWLSDYFEQTSPKRSDFTHDGLVSAMDFATWIQVFLDGGSTESGSGCP